jgi:uncharacterized phage-associated protein
MEIKRKSLLTGVERVREMNITQDQLNAWAAGALIQKVFPHLSSDDREFIKTGITGEEWEAYWEESNRDEFIYDV